MLSSLELLFGKFSTYIAGFFGLLSLVCGIGWFITAYQLDAAKSQSKLAQTQLQVSNGSYDSIKEQFKLLTDTMNNNRAKYIAERQALDANVQKVIDADKTRLTLEKYLTTRPPQSDCKTPKDLNDAWSKL